jgi:hypothetical protein
MTVAPDVGPLSQPNVNSSDPFPSFIVSLLRSDLTLGNISSISRDIAKMSAAFGAALDKLGLVDRSDPPTHEVAKLIIDFAKQGQRDPERLCALALQRLAK